MVLRESGRKIERSFNILGLVDREVEIGVDGGNALANFADAVLGEDLDRLNQARAGVQAELGPAAVSAAAIIAGNFSKNDRIANAIGIPAESHVIKGSEDFREALGINAFRSARNSLGK